MDGATVTEKYYLGSLEYNASNLEAIYQEEGRAVPIGAAFEYQYSIRDHLGNNRVMFKMVGSTATLIQESHFYPFGMEQDGNFVSGSDPYLFNGLEFNEDLGLNTYTAKFRTYDPAIGRWWRIDPKYSHSISPYCAMGNNPVILVDPLGDTTHIFSERGRYINTIYSDSPTEYHFVPWKDRKNYQGENVSESFVRENSSYFIGEETKAQLISYAQRSEEVGHEIGGLLYVGENRELQLKECTGCETEGTSIKGMQNLNNYSDVEGLQFIGSWHTHPKGGVYNENAPSGTWPGRPGDLQAFEGVGNIFPVSKASYRLSGGLGIISNVNGLVAFQHSGNIYDISKANGTVRNSSFWKEGSDGNYFSTNTRYNPLEKHSNGKSVYENIYKFTPW